MGTPIGNEEIQHMRDRECKDSCQKWKVSYFSFSSKGSRSTILPCGLKENLKILVKNKQETFWLLVSFLFICMHIHEIYVYFWELYTEALKSYFMIFGDPNRVQRTKRCCNQIQGTCPFSHLHFTTIRFLILANMASRIGSSEICDSQFQ